MTMATEIEGKKISELTERTELTGNEMIPFAEGGANGKVKLDTLKAAVQPDLSGKQDTLVSGTNIKTVNGQSVLGSGDLAVDGKIKLIASIEDIPEEIMPMFDYVMHQGKGITAEQFSAAKQYLQSNNNVNAYLLSIMEENIGLQGFFWSIYVSESDVICNISYLPYCMSLSGYTGFQAYTVSNTGEIDFIYNIQQTIQQGNNSIFIGLGSYQEDSDIPESVGLTLRTGGSSGEFLGADGEYHDLETRLSGIEARLAALEGGGTA